jgi:hypothetical protein
MMPTMLTNRIDRVVHAPDQWRSDLGVPVR